MNNSKKQTFRTRLFVWSLHFGLMLLFALTLPIFLIAEKFFLPEDRDLLWRMYAHRVCRMFFKAAGITIVLLDDAPDPRKTPTVFVSNHPTMIDGFLYFTFLGPHIVPLSAPIENVAFPFNIWFKKMGIIDVSRDEFDDAVTKKANSKKDAIDKMIQMLNEKNTSILIFPEGHIEKTNTLHYIHTGAVRVAIRAKAPIVVGTLIGMDKIIFDKYHGQAGTVRVHFTKRFDPPKVTKALPFRAAVKQMTKELENTFIELLPSRNIPSYITEKRKGTDPKKIGIFVDIDNTIYEGYSQQHFVKYLMKHKRISRFTMVRIFWYLLLEKMHLMSHNELMNRALAFTKGWKEEDMYEVADIFFQEQVVPNLYHNMLPPLMDHKKYGHTIIFVTEVIDPLAEQFKKYFRAKDARGTLLEKKNGYYTGNIVRLCKGKEKAEQVLHCAKKYNLDLEKSYAYGDSLADMDMLNSVRYACAVRPDSELSKHAGECHWEVIH